MPAFLFMGLFTNIRHLWVSSHGQQHRSSTLSLREAGGPIPNSAPRKPTFLIYPLTWIFTPFYLSGAKTESWLKAMFTNQFPQKIKSGETLIDLGSWFLSNRAGYIRRGKWEFVQRFQMDFWILLRLLITVGDDYPVSTYLTFRLTALSPSTIMDYYTTLINGIYTLLTEWWAREEWDIFQGWWTRIRERRGDGMNGYGHSGVGEGLLQAVGRVWWWWYQWAFVEHFMHFSKCFTCINPFSELIKWFH